MDLKKKKPVARVAREAHLLVSSNESPTGSSNTVTYQAQTALTLQPGRYQLRASAISTKLGKGGSVYLETQIPNMKKAEIELGGMLLGYARGPRVPVVPGGLTEGILPFAPTLDRVFSRADSIRAYCDVLGRLRATADVVVDLVDGSGEVIWSRHLSALHPPAVDLTVSLDDLAGDYCLRVTAAGGATTARREVGFVVR